MRQQIEDDSTEDLIDWSRRTRSNVAMDPTRVEQLCRAERLLRLDYQMRGLIEYKEAADAIGAIITEAAPNWPR